MRKVLQALALLSLAVCLAAPVMAFQGAITTDAYKDIFLGGTVGWFVCATLGFARKS